MSRAGPVGRNRSWTADRYIAACRPWSVILFRWVCGMRVMRLKPVCRPSAATIPTSGSTPSRRSPKPPESPPCFARSTGFRSVGRPRTDRTPLTPSTGLGTFGRLRATEGGIRCDSQRYVARYCRRYLARCGSARCRWRDPWTHHHGVSGGDRGTERVQLGGAGRDDAGVVCAT